MAIDSIGAEALALLPHSEGGRFLMLGRQHLTLTASEWRGLAARYERLSEPIPGSPESLTFAEPFLHWLGFPEVESLDYSDYEACNLVHDLNQPIPAEWAGRYRVVFDGGTLEHIFHFPTAISNAMRLVEEGGSLVSCTTSNNYNGHGFYQFSPELFCRIFEECNGFRIRLIALAETTGTRRIFRVSDPKRVGHRITFGGSGPLLMVLVAEKVREVPPFQSLPAQSDYAATWEGRTAVETASGAGPKGGGLKKRLLRRVGSVARAFVPDPLLQKLRRELAERDRARRSLRGVTQVATLSDCWDDLKG